MCVCVCVKCMYSEKVSFMYGTINKNHLNISSDCYKCFFF